MRKQSLVVSQMNPGLGTPIRTTILELIETLSSLTRDDNLVISAVKEIFTTHRIMASRSMAAVKLVANKPRTKIRVSRGRSCLV